MVKKPSIPNIPLDAPPQLRSFLEATREMLQTMAGHRGEKLEKAVTFRDLVGVQDQLRTIRRSLGDAGIGSGTPQPPVVFEPVPAVTNFAVVGGFTAITLYWDMVSFRGYQFSRVWRSSTQLFEDAVTIAESPTSLYVDVVGAKQQYTYWVQHVGSAYRDPGNAEGVDVSPGFPPTLTPPQVAVQKILPIDGPLTIGAEGVTSADYDDIKDQIRDDLLEQINAISLQFDQAIAQLDAFFGGGDVQDFVGLLAALDSRLVGISDEYLLLTKTLFDSEMSLHRERTKRAEDTAFVQRRVTETRSELRNLASSFDLVYADFYNPDGYLAAKVLELNQTIADLETATASRFVQIEADVDLKDSQANARITELQQSTADADQALAFVVEQIDAKFTDKDTQANARIQTVEQALASGEGTWASRAETIEASLGQEKARIDTVSQAITAPSGSVFAAVGTMINATRANLEGQISSATNATLDYVRNDTGGIVSQTISDYRVTRPDGGTATLNTLASVAYNTSGEYSALWGVKSTVGPTTAGVALYNDGSKTSFIVNAQQFAIHQGSGASLRVPFSFQFAWINSAGFVWSTVQTDYPPGVTGPAGNAAWTWAQTLILDNAYIRQAAVLRLAAKEITAEKIDATGRIRGGLFSGGVVELASVGGVWPIIQARGSLKTLEIDPNHPAALWFGDNTFASSIGYNEATLTPSVTHRGKSQANANFALGGDGSVFIRRDSGGFSCLHNPNSTFFMWFGPTSGAANPTYANAIWYLDNLGRYPLPLVTKRASGEFSAAGGGAGPVVHLAQGSTITVTIDASLSISSEVFMNDPGTRFLDFLVTYSLRRNGSTVRNGDFYVRVNVENSGPGLVYMNGSKTFTTDVVLNGIPPGEQTFSITASINPLGVPASQHGVFEGYSIAFRTFEVKEF
jgi:hypothetical protein